MQVFYVQSMRKNYHLCEPSGWTVPMQETYFFMNILTLSPANVGANKISFWFAFFFQTVNGFWHYDREKGYFYVASWMYTVSSKIG